MKLIQFQVNHFRNFIDSTLIKVEPNITCLVGKNESGKTALLHALYRLNPARSNVSFSLQEQYPAWLEKQHRLQGIKLNEVIPITVSFELEKSDIDLVEEKLGVNIITDNHIDITRDYSGTLSYTIQIDENKYVKQLISQRDIPEYLLKEISKNTTIELLIKNIEKIQERINVTEEVKRELSDLSDLVENISSDIENMNLSELVWKIIEPRVPEFFYFHTFSTLPYSVEIDKILNSDEDELEDDEITARSLLRLAAADDDYLLNPDYERRKRELENVANSLSNDVLKYWTQNPSLRVLPDITQKTIDIPQGQKSVLDELKIRIWDGSHLLSLPFNEHSTGFQWFFSFLAAFSEFEYKKTPVVILLDEPALGLHARAQSDFIRFIEERLTPRHQVIYTTHSPFMIQPNNLERVRIVEDKGRENGASISTDIMSTDPDTLFPLQGALGYDLIQHLFINEHNLLVEGTSDFTYITVISDYLKENKRISLDEKWSVVPVGGIDLIPTFVALLGHHLDITVLIDAQRTGHQKLSSLSRQGYLSRKKIITIGDVLKRTYADIEDLFLESDFVELFNKAFSDSISIENLDGTDPIISKICRFKKIKGFDHGKIADYFLRNRDVILPELSKESCDNFETLFVNINKTLTT